MSGFTTRLSGGLLAGFGSVLGVFFLADAATSTDPVYWVIQSYPIALSVALACVGVLLARGRLVADRFVRRLLAWVVVSVVVFSLFLLWFYGLAVLFRGRAPLEPPIGIVTLPALGALVGLLIGTYDARAVERKQAARRLSETNETLRIATSELVEKTDRDALERAVCERLVESGSFDAAWIGRYDSENGQVRLEAWAGIDDDVVESIAIPVDGDGTTEDAEYRALDTRDEASVRDVSEETVRRWRAILGRHGVESMSAVPIRGFDRVHGLLGVYGDRSIPSDEHQQEVFEELGETVGRAIDSVRAHNALKTREEELVKQNDRLDEFVGVVSHDWDIAVREGWQGGARFEITGVELEG